jgi:hypothetical protein
VVQVVAHVGVVVVHSDASGARHARGAGIGEHTVQNSTLSQNSTPLDPALAVRQHPRANASPAR